MCQSAWLRACTHCDNIDLLSTMGVNQVGGGEMNDIWGWTDPLDGKVRVRAAWPNHRHRLH